MSALIIRVLLSRLVQIDRMSAQEQCRSDAGSLNGDKHSLLTFKTNIYFFLQIVVTVLTGILKMSGLWAYGFCAI